MAVYYAIYFVAGFVFGILFTFIIYKFVSKRGENNFYAAVDSMTDLLKDSFASISLDTLSKTTEHMIKITSEKLSSERELNFKEFAGQRNLLENKIQNLNTELDKLNEVIKILENKRNTQMGELRAVLADSQQRTSELFHVTQGLKETLSSKQSRGQWAERMADDVLNFSGLKEGINYYRQKQDEFTKNRPDFTFFLPNGLILNMDVKFPFENYRKFIDAADSNKQLYKKEFLKDVRAHIKAVSTRDYINPENGTVDCVLLFIPNEQIYGFIFDSDQDILKEASKNGVLLCSPVTILSILSIIRQAADNFVIEKKARFFLDSLKHFHKEWLKYNEIFDKLGSHIDKLVSEYRELKGIRGDKLNNAIDKLQQIECKFGKDDNND